MYVQKKSIKGERIGAAIVDQIILGFISFVLGILITMLIVFTIYQNNSYESRQFIIFNSDKSIITQAITFFVSLLFTFVYFTLIPYFTKGKTIGKSIVGIKVVSIDYKKASFLQLLIRNIFFFETLILSGISLIILSTINENNAFSMLFSSGFLGLLSIVINIVILIMILATSDERGFHDMIAKTCVVPKNFDIDKLNQVNAFERRDMEWAVFENEDNDKNLDILDKNNDDDKIDILNN